MAPTFQPLSQRAGEEHVGQLALRIRFLLVVALLAVDVIQVDRAPAVSHGRHGDDPGRSRPLDQVQQQMRQQEVTWREGRRVSSLTRALIEQLLNRINPKVRPS